jgi:GNAT superfamily N-acetyltransferase
MPIAATVEPLARHRALVPRVARWLVAEWPAWYGPGGPGNVDADVEAFAASEQVLPVGMVAVCDGVPAGIGALKAESIPSHAHLSPWAAAGFVVPALRGRGIGRVLLDALVAKSRELGFGCVYCGTSTAESLLVRAGWRPVEVIVHHDRPLTIFRSAA